jgi:hypothetical protein
MFATRTSPGFGVRDPAGDVIARFETFEEARIMADDHARAARLPAGAGACWQVVRDRTWRRPRVLHRAFPAPERPDDWGGEGPDGVREPRRPFPGSSSGAIELEPPA